MRRTHQAPFPAYPTVAIDGDLLAYTIESPRPGHPEANAIVVHDLSTGADVNQTQTDQSLYDLAVSGGIYSLRVMTATVSNLELVQLSRQSTQSQAYEGWLPAAGEGLVSWWDRGRSSDPGSHRDGMTFSGLCGASVGWQTGAEIPPETALEAFYSAPIDAVKRLFQ